MRGTRRYRLIAGALVGGLILVVCSLAIAKALRTNRAQMPIAVVATPIGFFDGRDSTRTRFGALEFRGGLALTSGEKAFGGISAIRIARDGALFLAVTDNGSWLRGRIVYRDERPAGIADAEMAPMLGPRGRPLATRGWFDAESLTELSGLYYVGIERVEKIVRFDYRQHGLKARGEPILLPRDFKSLTHNKSLECLASGPPDSPLAGTLIVVTERSLDAAGNHRSFLIKNGRTGRFTVKRTNAFDVSDCAILPPDDLLLLERRFSVARGLATRIRRIALTRIKPGALVDGPPLIEADLAYQLDNMEGLSVNRNAKGETILTLVSDDNFSPLQRSILLQFKLVKE